MGPIFVIVSRALRVTQNAVPVLPPEMSVCNSWQADPAAKASTGTKEVKKPKVKVYTVEVITCPGQNLFSADLPFWSRSSGDVSEKSSYLQLVSGAIYFSSLRESPVR